MCSKKKNMISVLISATDMLGLVTNELTPNTCTTNGRKIARRCVMQIDSCFECVSVITQTELYFYIYAQLISRDVEKDLV